MEGNVEQFVSEAAGVESAESVREGRYLHVYHGTLADVDGTVRILTLAPDITDEKIQTAFVQTAQDWQTASTQPNVVTVYDSGSTPRPWVATDLLEADPLSEAGPELSPADRNQVIEDVAEALRVTDLYNARPPTLTPETVLLVRTDDGVTALVDEWGLERACRVAAGESPVTPYTPPELLAGEPQTEQSSVYEFAAVSYYLLTGRSPVDAGEELPARIDASAVAPPSEYDDDLPASLDDVLLEALATEPAERYQSTRAFKRDILDALPESARAGGRGPGRRAGGVGAASESGPQRDGSTDTSSTDDGGFPASRRLLGLGAVVGVAILALLVGGVVMGELPLGGGDSIEVQSAELHGVDGVLVEGTLGGADANATFTLRIWEGEPGDDDPVVAVPDLSATADGNGRFNLSVEAATIDSATSDFDYLGDTDYEVTVEAADGQRSDAVSLDRGQVSLELSDTEWQENDTSVTVTGSLTQGGAPVTEEEPSLQVTLSRDQEEQLSPREFTYQADDGTLTFTIPDEETALDLARGGEVTIAATYGGAEDTISADLGERVHPFDVDIVGTNDPVTAGDSLAVEVTLTHDGDEDGSDVVELDAGDLGNVTEEVTVPAGGSSTETFEVGTSAGDAGEYELTAATRTDQDSTTITVENDSEPFFEVDITGTNETVTEGEPVETVVQIQNTGDENGTQSIVLDGESLGSDTQSVSLESGESTTETFTLETSGINATEYTVTVSSDDNEDTTAVSVQELAGPSFDVEVTTPEPSVTAGESLSVTVEVTNTGDENGTQTVVLDVGSLGNDSTLVSLAGGESRTETLSVGTESGDAGTYTAQVSSENATAESTVDVEELEDPDEAFYAVEIIETNQPLTEGETVELTVKITNTGDLAGSQSIELGVNDLGTDMRVLSLDGGESTTRTFTVGTGDGDAGQYIATVSSENDSVTTSISVQGEPAEFDVDITGVSASQSSVDLMNTEIIAGATLEVVTEITNVGEQSGTQTITLSVDELGSDSTPVSLAGGGSKTETFTFETSENDAGEYDATVSSQDHEDTEWVTVIEPGSGSLLSNLDIAGQGPEATIAKGDPASVSVVVTNDGGTTDQFDVILDIGSGLLTAAESTGTLDPGEKETVTFSGLQFLNPGSYDIAVSTDDDSLSGSLTVEPNSVAGTGIERAAQLPRGDSHLQPREFSAPDSIGKVRPGRQYR